MIRATDGPWRASRDSPLEIHRLRDGAVLPLGTRDETIERRLQEPAPVLSHTAGQQAAQERQDPSSSVGTREHSSKPTLVLSVSSHFSSPPSPPHPPQ